jgi:xylulokinase
LRESVTPAPAALSVGLDIGTTSVKGVVADADGRVHARARVVHGVLAPAPDLLEHDARRAWRQGPRRVLAELLARVGTIERVAGIGIAAMVPSLTAVNERGVPISPGLLYGDARGRGPLAGTAAFADPDTVADAQGQLRWTSTRCPDARGYWPAQAVASFALCRVAGLDTAAVTALGELFGPQGWDARLAAQLGARVEQLPEVVPMGAPLGALAGTRGEVPVAAGTVDALADQLVAGADEAGDVFVVLGATLVAWVVAAEWVEVPGYLTVPHTVPGRVLVGGPSNAGALFLDWARGLLGVREPPEGPLGLANPDAVPLWLPYVRGERAPVRESALRASLHGLDLTHDRRAVLRAAYEASAFVVRRLIEASGVPARRVVASGGGVRDTNWLQAIADATGLVVEATAVPEGAALGAAFLARMAAGLEQTSDDARHWAQVGRRVEPDARLAAAMDRRFAEFVALTDLARKQARTRLSPAPSGSEQR